MSQYFPDVAWRTVVRNVTLTSTPHYYEVDVFPINPNEPGANPMLLAEGYYLIDNGGYPFLITNVNITTITVYDINERTWGTSTIGPRNNLDGYIYESKNGAFVLTQAQLRYLDKSAPDIINPIEKGVLWSHRGLELEGDYNGTPDSKVNITKLGLSPEFILKTEDVGWQGGKKYNLTLDGLFHNDIQGVQGTGLDDNYFHLDQDQVDALWTKDGSNIRRNSKVGINMNPTYDLDLTGNAGIIGNLYIQGNIYQNGSIYETHAEQIYTKKDYIITREGAASAIPSGALSGIQVTKYNNVNDLVFGTDSSGFFKVGEIGSLQILGTREDVPQVLGVPYYNSALYRWDTTSNMLYSTSNSRLELTALKVGTTSAMLKRVAGVLTDAVSGTDFAPATHNLLSTTHSDTLEGTVARGDIMIGNSTPKWARLAFPATPTGKVLVATATDVAWSTSALGTAAYKNIDGGTTGHIPFFTDANTLGNDAGLFWDNGAKKLIVDSGSFEYIPIFAKASLLISSKYYASIAVGYSLSTNQSSQFGYVYDTVTPTNSFAHITPFGKTEGSVFMVRADGNVGIGTDPIVRLHTKGSEFRTEHTGSYTALSSYISGVRSWQIDNVSNDLYIFDGTNYSFVLKHNTGSVGFGTLAPRGKVHVYSNNSPAPNYYNGELQVGGDFGNTGDISLSVGTNFATKVSFLQSWYAGYGTANMLLNPMGGNVGIGTVFPQAKIHTNTGTDQNFWVGTHDGKLTLQAVNDAATVNVPLRFYASEYNFMTGNVGIGTVTPSTTLHLASPNVCLNLQIISAAGTQQNPISRKITWSNYLNTTQAIIDVLDQNYDTARSDMVFSTMHNDGVLREDMRLRDGRLGIGEVPSVKLQVTDGQTLNKITALFTQGGSDHNFRAGFSNGSSTAIDSEQAKVGMWYGVSGDPLCHIGFLRGGGANSFGMTFNVNNVERLRIDPNGNVGFGTSPTSKLDVYDDTAETTLTKIFSGYWNRGIKLGVNSVSLPEIQAYVANTNAATNLLLNPAGGAVAINKTTVTSGYQLDVEGAVAATGLKLNELTASKFIKANADKRLVSSNIMATDIAGIDSYVEANYQKESVLEPNPPGSEQDGLDLYIPVIEIFPNKVHHVTLSNYLAPLRKDLIFNIKANPSKKAFESKIIITNVDQSAANRAFVVVYNKEVLISPSILNGHPYLVNALGQALNANRWSPSRVQSILQGKKCMLKITNYGDPLQDDQVTIEYVEMNGVVDDYTYLTVNPTSVGIAALGGSANAKTITVSSNITGVSITKPSGATWITLSKTSGNGDFTFNITASENTSTDLRSSTVTVSGSGISRTITVVQAGTSTPVADPGTGGGGGGGLNDPLEICLANCPETWELVEDCLQLCLDSWAS